MKFQRQATFTLVELLVVIAIIAILASMFLPALNKARTTARAITCTSQLKQSMLGCTMYASDNNEQIPFWLNSVPWVLYLSRDTKYLNRKMLVCPAGTQPKDSITNTAYTYTYGMYLRWETDNAQRIQDFGDFYFESAGKLNIVMNTRRARRTSSLAVLADTVYAKGSSNAGKGGCYCFAATQFQESGYAAVYMLHSRKANIGFLDGHVEAMSAGDYRKEPFRGKVSITGNLDKLTIN